MTTTYDICEPFVKALRTDRERLNQQFAQRKLAGCQIESSEFLDHLATVVDPIVAAVAEHFPERVAVTVRELTAVSLDLFAARLLGPAPRIPHVAALWGQRLPKLGRLLGREPARLAGSLSNAVYQIAGQPDGRPEFWMEQIEAAGTRATTIDEMLSCGQVLAWKAGLAQYREAALLRAAELPLATRALVLDCDIGASDAAASQLDLLLDRLRQDPWLRTDEPEAGKKSLRVVKAVGAFRGFGGAFLRPPLVTQLEGHLCVNDGEGTWQLAADAYGWHLHRMAATSLPSHSDSDAQRVQISPQGDVTWGDQTAKLPELVEPSSWAVAGNTLAVTLHSSHQVYLVACG